MVQGISHNRIPNSLINPNNRGMEIEHLPKGNERSPGPDVSDRVNLRSESSSTVTYSGAAQLHAADRARYGMLQNLVANLLQEQGIHTKIAIGDKEIDIAALTPEKARELISDDGYFGVEQTSDRIFQFAVGTAGGDPSRIEAIKEGIDKGFAEAKKAFGDWLPDISYQTYDAVMEKLDAWVAESKAVA
ncbi:hypothetical protein [Desulfobulbus alkaliphilus]|uniref:hypothetical protein n=1 Tax=Desulfobulbus alkaliphilus TaxID=869814 RepID=UPI0019651B20|nr:hypothetical protein [Desulfobulbus alkaliphilus]MBM9537406.1 hypothetical protein [Desulfobulbus alkaliphilus]